MYQPDRQKEVVRLVYQMRRVFSSDLSSWLVSASVVNSPYLAFPFWGGGVGNKTKLNITKRNETKLNRRNETVVRVTV